MLRTQKESEKTADNLENENQMLKNRELENMVKNEIEKFHKMF